MKTKIVFTLLFAAAIALLLAKENSTRGLISCSRMAKKGQPAAAFK